MMSHIRLFKTGTLYTRLSLLMALLVGNVAAALAGHNVTIRDFSIKVGEQKEVAVMLSTTADNVAEVKGTISLPKGMKFVVSNSTAYSAAGTMNSGANVALKPSTGTFDVRYIPKKAFTGKSGSVMVFKVEADETLPETSVITLSDVSVILMDKTVEAAPKTTVTVTLDSDETPDTPDNPDTPTETQLTLSLAPQSVDMVAGEETVVEVALANNVPLKGFEAKLETSEGITVTSVAKSDRLADGVWSYNNNKVTYLNLGGAMSGTEGTIFSVALKATSGFSGTATLMVTDVNATATGVNLTAESVTLDVNIISEEEAAKQAANEDAYKKLSAEVAELQKALDAAKNQISNSYPSVAWQFADQEKAIQTQITDAQKALDQKHEAGELTADSNIDAEKTTINNAIAKLKNDAAATQAAADAAAQQLAADKAAFDAYKTEQENVADALAEEGDSDAARQIIADAKNAIDALTYKEWKSLDENKADVDAIIAPLAQALANQRVKDA